MKKCKRCSEEKPLDQFGKNKRAKDKLSYQCKKCISEINKIQNIKFKETKQQYNRQYNKKYYKENRDGHYSVYLLPDHNYAGMTECIKWRMNRHYSDHGRNTDNVRVLYTTKSKSDALELEELLHDMGYEGRNENYTRRNY